MLPLCARQVACDSDASRTGDAMTLLRSSAARVVALALTLSAGSAAIAASGAARAVAVDQTVTMRVLPPIAQVGANPANPTAAKTAVAVSVTPSAAGRAVRLDRLTGRTWKSVAQAPVNSRGLAEFRVATYVRGTPVTYRATALAYQGLPAITSAPAVSTRWGTADFVEEFTGTDLSGSWTHRGPDYNPAGLRGCSRGSPAAVLVSGGAGRLSV